MAGTFRYGRLFAGILIVFIGLVLLANSLGYIEVDIWDMLSLWPVLLIFLGLSLIVGKNPALSIISIVVALIVIAVLILVLFAQILVNFRI